MDHSDVVLALTRWNQHLVYGGRVIHIVERANTPLLYIIESTSTGRAEDSVMRSGIKLLYTDRKPALAAQEFRRVLAVNPNHYGAMQALAVSLDKTGQSDDSRVLWSRILQLASQYRDLRTAETASNQLARSRQR